MGSQYSLDHIVLNVFLRTLLRGKESATNVDLHEQRGASESLLPHMKAVFLSWQERSLCAQTDPEAFFPEKGGSTREAKKVCVGCEVRSECLESALENDERFGIWGGLSERERRKLKKRAV